ncbi:translocation/assembly module TamB domain-containing protein [Azohydromonas caseinilytica]|uniref:DUF490 domain-containing protein n=1 Tax=Azohydromonas caseinilytica TaxID=2728836 RepID=A0A848FHJ8_9BURK|nr:translocation/assembly module TamB domain-containing protein [Azohydromonas caseinilytica]NML17733.1 DUF490 domain-containing protein [Azohydromonas caseinilytica]
MSPNAPPALPPAPAADTPPPVVPPRRRRRWWPALLLALAGLLVAGGAALWWALSPAGLAWWLPRAGVQVTGLRGGLQGGALAFDALRWQRSDGARLEIDAFTLPELRWTFRPPGGWLGLHLQAPQAARVAWQPGRAADETPPIRDIPRSLRLPLRLRVQDLRIATLQIGTQPPVHALRLTAELGAQSGSVHRLEALTLQWQRLALQASGQIGAGAPMALQAQVQADALAEVQPPWQAQLALTGTLAQIDVAATLHGAPVPTGGPARGAAATPSLDAQARLAPFADWPLQQLQARTQALDLSALWPTLPVTSLTGHADLRGGSAGAPLELDLALDNARPGRWSARQLPLRSAQLTLGARPERRDRLELQALALELGDAQGRAGSFSGSGHWEGAVLALEGRLRRLQPARLDARLPALQLDGPLALNLSGIALPGTPAPPAPAALALKVQAELRGTQDGGPAVQAKLALQARREGPATAARWSVALDEFDARAGSAQARAQAHLELDPSGSWQARTQGQLKNFDPVPWWPATPAPTTLSGEWDAQLSAAAGQPLPRALRGQAALTLAPGRLAGVPVQGKLSWRDAGAGLQAQARLQLGANRLELDGRAAGRAAPEWQVNVDAPALATLAPLSRLHPSLPALWPREGRLSAQAKLHAGGPRDWRTQGTLETSGLALGAWRLAQGQARWELRAPGRSDAPLALALDAAGLQQAGAARLDQLRARLQGRWSTHQVELDASSPLRPPAWADSLIGPSTGTELTLRGSGTWQEGNLSRWALQAQTLQARARGGRGTPWLSAAPLQAQLAFDPALRSVTLAPGALETLGLALRWSQLDWSAPATPDAPPRLRAQAELQALRVAPWLQRLQPGFGWGGDLEVGGRLRFDSADPQGSEVVVERLRGDLQRSDEVGGVQPFGMTDLRLALQVQNGRWTFTQAMAARHFGVLAGAQVVQSRPRVPWPSAQDPMQGVLELRVDDLGVWAPWVPPGWRLGGRLHAGAGLGGRFGAPEITGRLDASRLALRNLLLGVDLRDGEVAMALRGEDARIERFSLQAGDGTLQATGGARFGATPSAALQLQLKRFRVLGRFDRRLSVSGQAALALQAQQLALDGRLAVDEGLIDISQREAPALDADVTVLNRPHTPGGAATPGEPSALMRRARVDLRLDLGPQLRLRGQGIDTRLGGELAVSTPGGRPQLHGTVRTLQGRYAAYGQNLEIERGEIVFSGPVDNPRLDILALRPRLDEVRVGVQILGTAQNPRVRLYSEPEVSELDKLSWLVTGRAPDGLGRADTALLQRAALALLAGQDGDAAGRNLLRNLGLDDLAVRQRDDGELRQTVVSLGRQLSRRWWVGYERGIGSASGTWQLIYSLAHRFTLRGQSGEQNSVDLLRSWRWN